MSNTARSAFKLFTGASLAVLAFAGAAHAQQATPPRPAPEASAGPIEEIVVTAEKREAALQDVPIAVSAFSPDTLEALQIAGGPDLRNSIPNVSFAKGNFTGFNFQIRGIGSKLVATSGDSGVGVHLNGVPQTSSNLFEAEFFDVERVEVLRGPQGTLYGRNATGGVINVITAKPSTTEFEAYGKATIGNYNSQRLEGMLNLPIGDVGGLRIAGAQLKRDGFVDNITTGGTLDGRDLWSLRATLLFDLGPDATIWASYEKFQEDDDRLRSAKQLCIKDPGPASIGGQAIPAAARGFFSQGCLPGDVLNSNGTINYAATASGVLTGLFGITNGDLLAGKTVSRNLREIETQFAPIYRADSEQVTLNFNWDMTESLTLTALASHSSGQTLSSEDYNKVRPDGTFLPNPLLAGPLATVGATSATILDPQVGATNTPRTFDISSGNAEQTTFEMRLQSDFDGPLNFNLGGIKVDYQSTGDYYVMSNSLTAFVAFHNNLMGACAAGLLGATTCNPYPLGPVAAGLAGTPTNYINSIIPVDTANAGGGSVPERVTNSGRNYFHSRTPYVLDAFAYFGEAYFELSDTFKITGGLRYTSDKKKTQNLFSALFAQPRQAPVIPGQAVSFVQDPFKPENKVSFEEVTGRFGFDWKFGDDNLLYAFYSKGYKGGGINPPPAIGVAPIKATFEPEFVNAIEVGTKNTLADGRVQANVTGFHYDYQGYQISKIVNRTSLNENIDATISGLEFEGIWAPIDNLRLGLNAGYLKTEITGGRSIDVLNRTQGQAGLTLAKTSSAANCVVPTAVVTAVLAAVNAPASLANPLGGQTAFLSTFCDQGVGTNAPTLFGYRPSEGVEVNLSGKELPNSPENTISIFGEFTQPLGENWNAVFRGDYYYQTKSYSRIFNTVTDTLPAWDNLNLSVSLERPGSDFVITAFVKNAMDEDNVTDKYLTDDSSGLFTNVFLAEPRLYGVTISKRF